ncbi:MAG: hypothetical protein RR396_03280, partial [Clostridiales bacterium]
TPPEADNDGQITIPGEVVTPPTPEPPSGGGTTTPTINEDSIDTVISGCIKDINKLTTKYASLGNLGIGNDNNKVAINISDGNKIVKNVYDDVFNTLLNALKADAKEIKSVSTGQNTLAITSNVTFTVDQIEKFVQASGLKAGNQAISGGDKISLLKGQSFSIVITDTNNKTYSYTFNFNA